MPHYHCEECHGVWYNQHPHFGGYHEGLRGQRYASHANVHYGMFSGPYFGYFDNQKQDDKKDAKKKDDEKQKDKKPKKKKTSAGGKPKESKSAEIPWRP